MSYVILFDLCKMWAVESRSESAPLSFTAWVERSLPAGSTPHSNPVVKTMTSYGARDQREAGVIIKKKHYTRKVYAIKP